ncbi:MAG: hypothetical protein QM504_10280 [Pseudomonadota bacterium]
MKLIGITGKVVDINGNDVCITNSGKSVSAGELEQNLKAMGCKVKIKSLASSLVNIACKSTGLPSEYFTSQEFKNSPMDELSGKAPRSILINIGEELRAKYGNDVLFKILMSENEIFDGYIIVPDVRTQEEADFARVIGRLYYVHRYIHSTGNEFLRGLGFDSLDKATETPVANVVGDINVSLDVLGEVINIKYERVHLVA